MGKFSLFKFLKYGSLIIITVILFCVLIFILFPEPFINTFAKKLIAKSFTKANPDYTIRLGEMHYYVWENRLSCDTIVIKSDTSANEFHIVSFSVDGIAWMKILLNKDPIPNAFEHSVIDLKEANVIFHHSPYELRFSMLHISVPDSIMSADSIKFYSPYDDERFFSKSQFRRTKFRFTIPDIKISGLDYLKLLQGTNFSAKTIKMHKMFLDILINKDKPYDESSPKPQMPNEILSSLKLNVRIDSLILKNGQLKYREQFIKGEKPGIITFSNSNITISGIVNHAVHPKPAVVQAEGLFLNSSLMKLKMSLPLYSRDFSLQYSGSLNTIDVTKLNSFLETAENHRVKSGILEAANYNITVDSGKATGTVGLIYKDLSVVVINKNSKSEKGLLDKIVSFIGKLFVTKKSNQPDSNGNFKIGKIDYTRKPDDYFLQFIWFALRSGIGDVVGF